MSSIEFIDGQTLTQWMIDNPKPDLEMVRDIVEQIAKGLQAFHRMEMLHQDLRPDNIMIDRTGTAKIIDFGSTRDCRHRRDEPPMRQRDPRHRAIHGARIFPRRRRLAELRHLLARRHHLSDADGPAALWGPGRARRGQGRSSASCTTAPRSTRTATFLPGSTARLKAVHPDPYQRYEELSEFVFDLRHPNKNLF